METGPLVVQEAQALGIPVMGARLGGIAERVRDGVDGWLLPFDNPQRWTEAITEAVMDRGKLARLARNTQRTRTMGDVASDVAAMYAEIMLDKQGPPTRGGIGFAASGHRERS